MTNSFKQLSLMIKIHTTLVIMYQVLPTHALHAVLFHTSIRLQQNGLGGVFRVT